MAYAKCPEVKGYCPWYSDGHALHVLHARRVAESPWGWRDAVVVAAEGRSLVVDYLSGEGGATLWHHFPLEEELPVGSVVRVHEGYHVIGAPIGWLNVRIVQGIGAVAEPDDKSLWRSEWSPAVVDLGSGRAIALDHANPGLRVAARKDLIVGAPRAPGPPRPAHRRDRGPDQGMKVVIEPFQGFHDLICTIPGISTLTADIIVAETGSPL